MENDIRNENNENLVDMNDYFQLDFAKEDLKGNRKFEEFKKQRLNELGKDAKLFHCKNDNIYFYVNKKECKTSHYSYKQCPLCKNYICYFCERIRHNINDDGKFCCISLILYKIFFVNGFFYKDYSQLNEYSKKEFKKFIILDLIPLTKWFMLVSLFWSILFAKLLLKDKKWKKQKDYYTTYDIYILNEKYTELLFFIIMITFGFPLSICYTIITMYFNILILLVSLFTKFYPLKYSVGVISIISDLPFLY